MQVDEMLTYLKNIDDFSLSPWVALAEQTEAIGDPATPSREQIAILRWLGKALELWEKQSPLEGRVGAQIRRLKPLSAALAVTDPTFLQPGAHPVHQLLDSIQDRAIGWQARLDRVGAILEQQVTKAVDDSRQWFDKPSTDLSTICAAFSAAAERDQARAKRMVQRVVEAEAGKIKTAAAKQEAARMINAALETHPAPEEIGRFLKGPWYTSAQLLLLKYGEDSEQWEKMSATTKTLLDSFQNTEGADEARRQHIFDVVTKLPKEMRRWLLSLHHDTEAVNESMGLVEFAHLRILRRQSLELLPIAPIVVADEHASADNAQTPGTLKHWHEGQWFSVDKGGEGVVRVQLVLKVEQSQRMLFTNLAGIKVLQLSFAEFDRLVAQDKVRALYSGASFSLCLAQAVGIDSVEILDALASALAHAEPEPEPELPTESAPATASKPGAGSAAKSTRAKKAPKPMPEPEADVTLEPDLDSDLDLELDLELAPDSELDLETASQQEPELQPEPEREQDRDLQTMSAQLSTAVPHLVDTPREQPEEQIESLESAAADLPADHQPESGTGAQAVNPPPARGEGFLIEQAEEIKARGGYFAQRREDKEDESDTDIEEIFPQAVEDYPDPDSLVEQAGGLGAAEESSHDVPEDDDASLESLLAQAGGREAEPEPTPDTVQTSTDGREDQLTQGQHRREVNLPMGAWLGFHDGETPLMARLAVYDLENDHYIFVNRQGVKIRQVTRLELLDLIDNNLVDILETHSNFRDAVTEVRKNLDQE